ncbi:hypothetical protein IQ07DRAFT_590203 [Pyrenochaeta sp. DS3sAY3a]|nr:hypothetical protein IQ07DRAFT_590203 [Pyrenochaeta sp. DS3sAY3a]
MRIWHNGPLSRPLQSEGLEISIQAGSQRDHGCTKSRTVGVIFPLVLTLSCCKLMYASRRQQWTRLNMKIVEIRRSKSS